MIGPNVNVRVEFVGKLEDGTVFDSSEMNGPLEFMTDCRQVIRGLDRAVQDMEVGETRTVIIPAEDAYGPYDERNIQQRELRYIPNAEELPVGQVINFFGPAGQKVPAKVLRVDDTYAYLDFNHRLAGKDLVYELTVTEILPRKTRRTPISSYGGMARTADTRPVREQPVFNNLLENLGLSSSDVMRKGEEELPADASE
ncbi:MAG: peptidylprolyl isomerase [Eggerthellaceae bacterium]|nr:peptidylprolyl isomerase [Eggerthellaceae bacterium]